MTKIKMYSVNTLNGNDTAAKGSASNPYTQKEYETMLDNDTWPGGYVEGLGYCLKGVTVTASSSNSGSRSWGSGSMFDYWSSMDSSYPWDSDPMDYLSSLYPSETENGNGTWSGTGNSNSGSHNNGGGSENHGGSSYNPYPQKSRTVKGTALGYLWIEGVGGRSTFVYQYDMKITGYTLLISAIVQPGNFNDRYFWANVTVNDGDKEIRYELDTNLKEYAKPTGWTFLGYKDIPLPKSGNVTVYLHIGYNHDSGAGHGNSSTDIKIYPF